MTVPPTQPTREFAEVRSHKDREASNETGRATAQAAILINGGAATAVLAFVAKEGISATVVGVVALCLIGYVIGVVFGGCMLFLKMLMLNQWGNRWHWKAWGADGKEKYAGRLAARYWKLSNYCFALSMFVFVAASSVVAWTLATANPLQTSTPSPGIAKASPSPSSAVTPPATRNQR